MKKLTLLALMLTSCASGPTYWQQRAAMINQLPPEQRAQAQIDLMRDQYAARWQLQQANQHVLERMQDQTNPPGSYTNPIHVAGPYGY